MRLLTHNMLASNVRGVSNGYPLRLEATKWSSKAVDLNADFLRGVLPKIDWPALSAATRALGLLDLLPAAPPLDPTAALFVAGAEADEGSLLRRFHHALLEIHVEEGALVCPESGRRFPISKGVPNMLLHEDEV